jgi:3-hydroxyisobutyrate dehydrogenase-like beta-hydroxyacid dehydrogenase
VDVSDAAMSPGDIRVGVVGLGIMGSAIGRHLLAAGFPTTGYDIVPQKIDDLVAQGGMGAGSPADVARHCDVLVTSLATVAAVRRVVGGDDGVAVGAHPGLIVVDTNTMPLAVKEEARSRLQEAAVAMLDCTLSGTGAQAAHRDLAVYASGDRDAFERALPVLEAVSRSVRYVGEFGAGSKMKFVANLLVAIHNVAAAEAFLLGSKAGLDADLVYDVIREGAGTSRMFEVRGPMMVARSYEDASATMSLFLKDVSVIDEFGRSVGAPLPLFSATLPVYAAAMSQGRADQDPAAVSAVLETLAGLAPDAAGP